MISALLCLALLAAPLAAATCDSLGSLKLPDTTITSAATVAPGAFTLPASLPSFKKLPAFCRVQGVIQPSSDSHIEFEVWIPSFGWNGKYPWRGQWRIRRLHQLHSAG